MIKIYLQLKWLQKLYKNVYEYNIQLEIVIVQVLLIHTYFVKIFYA